jgi:hypothetical protein
MVEWGEMVNCEEVGICVEAGCQGFCVPNAHPRATGLADESTTENQNEVFITLPVSATVIAVLDIVALLAAILGTCNYLHFLPARDDFVL